MKQKVIKKENKIDKNKIGKKIDQKKQNKM